MHATSNEAAPQSSHHYVKSDTAAYYFMSSDQVTVPQHNGTYDTVLTAAGRAKLDEVQASVRAAAFTGTIHGGMPYPIYSGMWFPNVESRFYARGQHFNCLNSFDNLCVYGWIVRGDRFKPIVTSQVIFHNLDWCYTATGSLYRICNDRSHTEYYQQYLNQSRAATAS